MPVQGQLVGLSFLVLAAQLSLGIIFLLSAIPKIRQPIAFAHNVIAYDVLPIRVAHAFALIMIPLEALLAISFLTGWLLDSALPIATIILIAFAIAVGINLRRNRKVPCGCFGDASEQISPRTLVRLLLLLVTTLLLLILRSALHIQTFTLGFLDNTAAFTYLLLAIFLAAFFILLASWLLNLPELISLIGRQTRRRSSSSHVKAGNEL